MTWLKRIGCLVVVLALLAAGWIVYLYDAAGELRTLEEVELQCREVSGAAGAEDIEYHRPSGMAILSSTDRAAAARGERVSGGLYLLDVRDPDASPRLLTERWPDLEPHGISLVEIDETRSTLFVVNHAGGRHSVEIFELEGDRLTLVDTVRGALLISPNDVAGVGGRRFYVTNDHGSSTPRGKMREDYLRLARGSVVYYDGETLSKVHDGIAYANGIATSPDFAEVYVASTTTGEVLIFDRDADTGSLSEPTVVETGTGVDNIDVDRLGKLWIAAHPKLLTFTRHAADPDQLSPSEVLWVDPEGLADPPVRTVWLDLGDELSGASVAVSAGDRIVVGSVFEPHVLICLR